MTAPLPHNEAARLALLHKLALLDSAPEPEFDRITQLAADMLDVPIAVISLVDRERQWFKSCVGLDATETPRSEAFCAHAILSPEPLIVRDALTDPRFNDNPIVQGAPHIRFYAGIPLLSSTGLALGTLCVVDYVPRTLSDVQLRMLNNLAEIARREIINREFALNAQAVSTESQRMSIESEHRFQFTFEQAAVGIAIVGTDGRWLQVNQKLCSIVGYSAAELLPLTYQDITHPDDLNSDLNFAQQLLDGTIDNYSLEKRYIRKDGEPVWINLTVSLMRDAAGKPLQFISVIEDIEGRKQTEQALRRLRRELEHRVHDRTAELQRTNEMLRSSQHQLQTIANNLPIQIAYVDAAETVQFINDTYRVDTGLTPETAVGKKLDEILHADFYRRIAPHVATALSGERTTFETSTRFRRQQQIWNTVYIPEFRGSEVTGFFIMSQDITARKQIEFSLHVKATRDTLTGLPNRSTLLEKLHSAAERANRTGENLALFFLDLDGFKTINDQYGHDVGDSILRLFAARLLKSVRSTDLVARLAGDEFVILLEALRASHAAADKVGQKILAAMREPFFIGTRKITLSTSIGLYMHETSDAADAEEMLTLADQAMYSAKRSGKNRMFRFDTAA